MFQVTSLDHLFRKQNGEFWVPRMPSGVRSMFSRSRQVGSVVLDHTRSA